MLMQSSIPQFNHQGLNELITKICNSLSNGEMKILSDPLDDYPDDHPSNILISSNSCSCIN